MKFYLNCFFNISLEVNKGSVAPKGVAGPLVVHYLCKKYDLLHFPKTKLNRKQKSKIPNRLFL